MADAAARATREDRAVDEGRMVRVGIDRGGTFTDCVLVEDDGSVTTRKVLSTEHAIQNGLLTVLAAGGRGIDDLSSVRVGTTVATNALLERKGARVCLVVTRGFADLLAIGDQARPDLFDVRARRPPPLATDAIEVDARGTPWGEESGTLDEESLFQALTRAREDGVEGVAVALVHGVVVPDLERRVGAVARRVGFEEVVLSHEVSPRTGLLARAETSVVDAALSFAVRRALVGAERVLANTPLLVVQSTGDLVPSARARGKDLVLSGPAGGVVATRALLASRGLSRAIAFDMGGTSTDVARVTDRPRLVVEKRVGGVTLSSPHVDIETVAAGGGSIVRVEDGVLVVGPRSAGAVPGPIVYGHSEARELTVTDLDVVLGRLPPDRFPIPLDAARASSAVDALARALETTPATTREQMSSPHTREDVAERAVAIADARMAEAVRRVTLARGYDVTEHTLVVYGGAGGLHMCGVAERLGVASLLVPPSAGVFSAIGIADARRGAARAVDIGPLILDDAGVARAREVAADVARALVDEVSGVAAIAPSIALRDVGAEDALSLALDDDIDADALRARYRAALERTYGFARPERAVEIARVVVHVMCEPEGTPARHVLPDGDGLPIRETRVFDGGRMHEGVPIFTRASLARGSTRAGPVIIVDEDATHYISPRFSVEREADDVLVVRRLAATATSPRAVDQTSLALFDGAFTALAEEMGELLRRTALSVNMRERLDFSCAIFDEHGSLIVNAPHIPVHLGAMQESVRAVCAAHPRMARGDAFVTNDPAMGGSHLPDLTVVSPVFVDEDRPTFFVASRGHHADVGGITPGSMPPFSRSLDEEGVVLSAAPLAKGGVMLVDALRGRLLSGALPARDVEANLGDLAAQLAANARGAQLLVELARLHGTDTVRTATRAVRAWSARAVTDAIATLPHGARTFRDALDDGTPIVVTVEREGPERLRIDFTGSGAPVDGNLNAPRAVTVASVLYALRVLAARPIPLSAGCLDPVTLVIPEHSILDAAPSVAVCGGNVETSQRIVDVLLGALGVCAASQGTMNNLTFGPRAPIRSFGNHQIDGPRAYYETIGGGGGALPGVPGASGVQTHMTNTRITDVEVLERRFPVRVRRFALRRGSGGAGAAPGGDGVVREIEALAELDVALLSERRERAPFGLAGGGPGVPGRNAVNGRSVGGKVRVVLAEGDVLTIETPGGGGYGDP